MLALPVPSDIQTGIADVRRNDLHSERHGEMDDSGGPTQVRLTTGRDRRVDKSVSAVRTEGSTSVATDSVAGQVGVALGVRTEARKVFASPLPDYSYMRMARYHFAKELIACLDGLEAAAGQPSSAPWANQFFQTVRKLELFSPLDEFLIVVLGLNNALRYENRWAAYSKEQFRDARALLEEFASHNGGTNRTKKAIARLEALGFNTTPFLENVEFFESDAGIDGESESSCED